MKNNPNRNKNGRNSRSGGVLGDGKLASFEMPENVTNSFLPARQKLVKGGGLKRLSVDATAVGRQRVVNDQHGLKIRQRSVQKTRNDSVGGVANNEAYVTTDKAVGTEDSGSGGGVKVLHSYKSSNLA